MSSSPDPTRNDRLERVLHDGAKRRDRKRLLVAAAAGCLALISIAVLVERPGSRGDEASVRAEASETSTTSSGTATVKGKDLDRVDAGSTTTNASSTTRADEAASTGISTTTIDSPQTTILGSRPGRSTDDAKDGTSKDGDTKDTDDLDQPKPAQASSSDELRDGAGSVSSSSSPSSSSSSSTSAPKSSSTTQPTASTQRPAAPAGTQGGSSGTAAPRLAPVLAGTTVAEIVVPTGIKAESPVTVDVTVSGRGGMDCIVVDLGDGSPRWESGCSIPAACGVRQAASVSTQSRSLTANYRSSGSREISVWQRQRLAGSACTAETSLLVRKSVSVGAAAIPQRVLNVKVTTTADGPTVGGVYVSVRSRSGVLLTDTVTDRLGNAALRVPENDLVFIEAEAPNLDPKCRWVANGSAGAGTTVVTLGLRKSCQ